MAQKTAPFLESKFGWSFGESGWNQGMDENILKFSFMLDGGLDGVVSTLPTATEGQAYFLTTDNRVYYSVSNTWQSVAVPLWFTFKLKSDGSVKTFNGTSLVDSPSTNDVADGLGQLSSRVQQTEGFTTSLSGQDGSSLVGFKPLVAGTVGRSVKDKLNENISIKDFGATGDGSTNDRLAFETAHNSVPSGVMIYVPSGLYNFAGGDVTAANRRWKFAGDVQIIGGKLLESRIEQPASDGGYLFGGGVGSSSFSSQTKYRFGRTLGNLGATGLQIGGGNPDEGSDGTMLYVDSYSGWAVAQNSKYPGPQEFAVQPRPAANSATVTAGGNVVTAAVPLFSEVFVGKRIYLGDAIYLISEFISSTQVRVTNLNGSVVSFSTTATITCIVCYAGGSGICNVNGTIVSRVSGDPFIPMTNTEYKIKIGTTVYTVNNFSNPDSITLLTSAGNYTGVAYEWWSSVDNLVAAIRVHRVASAGFEENVTLSAHANGAYRLQALGSGGSFPHRQYPLYIGNGYQTGGAQRSQITLDGTNGDTLLGGSFDRYSLRIVHRDGVTGNSLLIGGTNAGSAPYLRSEGVDTSIDIQLLPKGDGKVWLGPTIAGTVTADHVMFVKNQAGQTFQLLCRLVP